VDTLGKYVRITQQQLKECVRIMKEKDKKPARESTAKGNSGRRKQPSEGIFEMNTKYPAKIGIAKGGSG
jgi:hypothetical protein